MPKLAANRRALLLANAFNLLTAIYFIIIAIVSLVHLRWYHQLTVTVRLRHVVTSATSYFAFVLLILVALVLMGTFVASTLQVQQQQSKPFSSRRRRALHADSALAVWRSNNQPDTLLNQQQQQLGQKHREVIFGPRHESKRALSSTASTCYSSLVYLMASLGLVLILVIWLVNTGELVRESIMSQLELAFAKYQFSNRSNHYSIAIDAMQDTNNCCGSLDYTDFPHQRHTGLSSGLYPGSCCSKNVFGVNARVLCTPEEIWHAKQTNGCTNVLANYYELISLLVVPVALVCLFVNISILSLATLAQGIAKPLNRANESRSHKPVTKAQRVSTTTSEHNNLAPQMTAAAKLTTNQ